MFTHLFDNLQDLQSQLLEQSLRCNQGCKAMMLGTLSQAMKSTSLLPLPLPPCTLISIDSTLQQLGAIEGEDYYCPWKQGTNQKFSGAWKLHNRPVSRHKYSGYSSSGRDEEVPSNLVRHNCRIEDHLKELLKTTEGKIEGLELSNYFST